MTHICVILNYNLISIIYIFSLGATFWFSGLTMSSRLREYSWHNSGDFMPRIKPKLSMCKASTLLVLCTMNYVLKFYICFLHLFRYNFMRCHTLIKLYIFSSINLGSKRICYNFFWL